MRRRQMSLKWGLALWMLGIWLFIVVAAVFVLRFLGAQITYRVEDSMARTQLAEADALVSKIDFEVAAQNKALLKKEIDAYLKKGGDVKSITVLTPDRNIFFSTADKSSLASTLTATKKWQKMDVQTVGRQSVVFIPIELSNGKRWGYLLQIVSLDGYLNDRNHIFLILGVLGIGGFIFILISSTYLLGVRTVRPMRKLMDAAQRITDGDLDCVHCDIEGWDEFIRLSGSIRSMGEAMQAQVIAIRKLTQGIFEISKENEDSMTNLTTSSTQQAAAVNETAVTMEELKQAGQSSAGNANQIVTVAEKTADASTRGLQTVEKTYEIMIQIKDESRDISEKSQNLLKSVEEVENIIQSVKAIAEQSKMLAINASIAATRAGKYGAGFGVVAKEVQNLAQRSKNATVQMTHTLSAIRGAIAMMATTAQIGKERTEEGVNTIANAGSVMNDLSEAIQENSNFANVIAANIKQQTIALAQIAAAIEQINSSARENQGIIETLGDGDKEMNDSLTLLFDMVGRWRMSDQE